MVMKEYSGSNLNLFYKDIRDGDIKHSGLCNNITMDALEWKTIYSIEEGIKRIVDYYKSSLRS